VGRLRGGSAKLAEMIQTSSGTHLLDPSVIAEPHGFRGGLSTRSTTRLTRFASSYSSEISLAQILDPSVFSECLKQSTGAKVLVNPQLDGAGG
jgi:hypothetical protein